MIRWGRALPAALLVACLMLIPDVSNGAGATTLVSSVPGQPVPTGGTGGVAPPRADSTGQLVAFASLSADYLPGLTDTNGATNLDLFLHDRLTGEVELLSHRFDDATKVADGSTGTGTFSASGRFVAFQSTATDLIEGFTPGTGQANVFVLDRATGITTLVSHRFDAPLTGASANSGSIRIAEVRVDKKVYPVIAFTSNSSDLVEDFVDNNAAAFDLYVFDGRTKKVSLVTRRAGTVNEGAPSPGGNQVFPNGVGLSANGKYIVYTTNQTELVSGFVDTNGTDLTQGLDVYVFNTKRSTNKLISRKEGTPATGGDGTSKDPSISANGRFIAFSSEAEDLFSTYERNAPSLGDLFLFDRKRNRTSLISHRIDELNEGADGSSHGVTLSSNGRFASFESFASDLVPAGVDTNGSKRDIFQYDRRTKTHTVVSRASAGGTPDKESHTAVPSASGDTVVFRSDASDLIEGFVDQNGTSLDVYVWHKGSGLVELVTHDHSSAAKGMMTGTLLTPSISADGSLVVFGSDADNLVESFVDQNATLSDAYAVAL